MTSNQKVCLAQHGTGFVGAAVLRALHEVSPDMSLIGVDVDRKKLVHLQEAHNISTAHVDEVDEYLHCNVHSFSIPTPCDIAEPDKEWGYNLTYLRSALRQFGARVLKNRNEYTLVIIRSTVYPGTVDSELIPILEEFSGKTCGVEFDVAYNPEFLAQETAYEDALHPPLIAMSVTSDRGEELFRTCFRDFNVDFLKLDNHPCAEWLKMSNNVLNAIFISACNELREGMVSSGIERSQAQKVMRTLRRTAFAKTKPLYGLNDFGAWGGACLPKEVAAMIAANSHRNIDSSVLLAAQQVNDRLLLNEQGQRVAAE